MELTKNHRTSLLSSLKEAEFQLENNKAVMDKQTNADNHQFFEAKHFLSQQIISIITQALIDNDIDY